MPPSHNPNSIFNQTKDWIDRGQAEVMRQHDIRAESDQTPLSLLVEDIKQNPQKHIQRLKRVMATAAVVATGMSSFNPNAVAQGQNPTQIETNTTQLQSNSEKSIQTNYKEEATAKAETKIVQQFVNQVFNTQSEYSSMQSGGTPKAIKHALENGGTITTQNAPQIIMEAIKTNNGATNPINLKHYKQQIKMFNLNIEAGYTPTQALIKSQADCAKLNPAEIKAPRIDLERLNNMVSKIGEECTDVNIDSLQGISDVQKAFIKTEVKKPDSLIKKPIPAQKPIDLLKLLEAQGKLPNVAPSISPSPTILASQDSKNSKNSQENTKNPINGPFNNPSNPAIQPKATVETTPDKGFEWFQSMNQKAIEDTLKQLGILLAVGGVATVAGIKTTKALYQKYQAWESTLPHISNDETRRIFWENVDKMKSDYQEKKVKKQNFDAKFKGVVVDKLIKNATEEGDKQEFNQVIGNNPVNFNSTDVKQININLLKNRPQPSIENLSQPQTQQPTELMPKLGERWSSFIAGFRQKFTNFTTKIAQPFKQIAENKRLIDQTKTREQGVMEDMGRYSLKKEHKKAGNVSKIVYNLRSMYNHLLLEAKPWFKDNRDEVEEYIKVLERNEAETTETPPAKPRSRIPDIDYENLPKIEDFLDPEEKRQFSNHDIQAYLVIARREFEIFRENTIYRGPAERALVCYNKRIKKMNLENLAKQLSKKNSLNKNPMFASEPLTATWLQFGINIFPATVKKKIENPHNYHGEDEFTIYTFERTLAVLHMLRDHYYKPKFRDNKDKEMHDAAEAILNYYQSLENELIAENTMCIELNRRKSIKNQIDSDKRHNERVDNYIPTEFHKKINMPSPQKVEIFELENVDGVCREFFKEFHSQAYKFYQKIDFLEKTSFHDQSKHLPEFDLHDACKPILAEFMSYKTIFDKDGKLVKKFELNEINYDGMLDSLNRLEVLIKKSKVKKDKDDDDFIGLNEMYELRRMIKAVQARLKYPPNSPVHATDIFETDVMPDLKTEPRDTKRSYLNPDPSRIIREGDKNVIKYPTSTKFPELLEKTAEAEHIKSVAQIHDLSNAIVALTIMQFKSLKYLITPQMIKELEKLIKILKTPEWGYRPYRKKKSETTEERLKQLFLDYASIDVDPI
jgi:phage terminase Nu1 subunit (DNA packaging protein)